LVRAQRDCTITKLGGMQFLLYIDYALSVYLVFIVCPSHAEVF